jgi:hypothetical protein
MRNGPGAAVTRATSRRTPAFLLSGGSRSADSTRELRFRRQDLGIESSSAQTQPSPPLCDKFDFGVSHHAPGDSADRDSSSSSCTRTAVLSGPTTGISMNMSAVTLVIPSQNYGRIRRRMPAKVSRLWSLWRRAASRVRRRSRS